MELYSVNLFPEDGNMSTILSIMCVALADYCH